MSARTTCCARLLGRRGVLVVLVIAVVASACTASRATDDRPQVVPAEGDSPRLVESVVMIGDSLTEGSQAVLQPALIAAGFEVARIDGRSSRRIAVGQDGGPSSGVEAVEQALADGLAPDAWVIALGTNDVTHYDSIDDFVVVIEEVLAAIPDDAMVVWVDVYLRDYPGQADVFNTTLRRVLSERSDTVVFDWSARAAAPGLVGDDGIHLTDAGNAAFATAVTEALSLRQG